MEYPKTTIFKVVLHLLTISTFQFSDQTTTNSDSDTSSREIISLDYIEYDSLKEHLITAAHVYSSEKYLLIVQEIVDENILVLFDSNTHEHLQTFGNKGPGPKEFGITPNMLQPYLMDEGLLEFYDWNKKRLVAFSLEDLLNSGEMNVVYEYHLPPRLINAQYAGMINNNITALTFLDEGLAGFSNSSFDSIHITPYDPYTPEISQITYRDKKLYFNAWPTVHPQRERILLGFERIDQILLMDFDGNVENVFRFGDEVPAINQNRKDLKYIYTALQATDKYIYAAKLNISGNEMEKRISPVRGVLLKKPVTEIHVFTWEGELVRIINTNNFITSFSVDPHRNRIIITNELEEDLPVKFFYSDIIE